MKNVEEQNCLCFGEWSKWARRSVSVRDIVEAHTCLCFIVSAGFASQFAEQLVLMQKQIYENN